MWIFLVQFNIKRKKRKNTWLMLGKGDFIVGNMYENVGEFGLPTKNDSDY